MSIGEDKSNKEGEKDNVLKKGLHGRLVIPFNVNSNIFKD